MPCKIKELMFSQVSFAFRFFTDLSEGVDDFIEPWRFFALTTRGAAECIAANRGAEHFGETEPLKSTRGPTNKGK